MERYPGFEMPYPKLVFGRSQNFRSEIAGSNGRSKTACRQKLDGIWKYPLDFRIVEVGIEDRPISSILDQDRELLTSSSKAADSDGFRRFNYWMKW